MDDRGLHGSMVDPHSPGRADATERPFALRSTIYTAAFLLFILGVVPSIYHFAGELLLRMVTGSEPSVVQRVPASPIAADIRAFWSGFRTLVGAGIFAIGLATYLACSAWLIFHGRGPHVEFDPPRHFVATGPYRWVRNPVVITLLIAVLGEAVYLASPGIALLLLMGMPIAHLQVTRLEEPLLRERFGQSYLDYCASVSRWLPHPPAD